MRFPLLPPARLAVIALTLLAGAVMLDACGGKGGSPKTPPDLVIMATGSFAGAFEPCGCKDGLGGLARRVGLRRDWEAANPSTPLLVLDAGRGFPMKTDETDVVVPTVRRAFQLLGVQVINVAETDLEAGLSPYLAATSDAPWTLVSCNLVSIDGDRPVVKPYVVVTPTVGGKPASGPRVAVIGATIAQRYRVIDGVGGDKVHFIDFQKALAEWLPKARAESDLVVLLGNIRSGNAQLIAKQFPDVDLVIAQDAIDDAMKLFDPASTRMVMTGTRGKYDVRVELRKGKGDHRWDLRPVITPLDSKITMDRDAVTFVGSFRTELTETTRLRSELIKKDPAFPDYLGSAACASCHAAETAIWRETRHSHAWEPLAAGSNTMNPLCLHCHTVGYMKTNGYNMARNDEMLRGVGCESCHGPGSRHAADPKGTPLLKPTETTCRGCHTPGQTPDFDFARYWPKIRHGTP